MPFIAEMNFEPRNERPSIQGTDSNHGHPPLWRCWTCQHDAFIWSFDDWVCEQCGSMGYYDAAASLRRETDDGVWLFMPKHGNSHGLWTPRLTVPLCMGLRTIVVLAILAAKRSNVVNEIQTPS